MIECLCCSLEAIHWNSVSNDYGDFAIVRCGSCHSGFVHPRPSLASIEAFYEKRGRSERSSSAAEIAEAENRYPNTSIDARRIVSNIKSCLGTDAESRRATFLDIGAGWGWFAMEAQNTGFDVTAIEVGEEERKTIKSMTGIDAYPSMFEEYQASENSFDAILMSQVLEHVVDVKDWLSKSQRLLRQGGILCIAVPHFGSLFTNLFGKKDPFIIPPEHLNFFSSTGLKTLLNRSGFEVVDLKYISRFPFASRHQGPQWSKRLIQLGQEVVCAGIDKARLGMFLNVFARKK